MDRVSLVIRTICLLIACAGLWEPLAAAEKPNIIIVLADDLGWSELGCYGNRFNETPHLDRLSKQGMRFTQAYAAAPVCSPYRAALLTGQYPARVGILDYLRPNSANALSQRHVTLAEVFQDNGYRTGMIGKWHLTGYKYHQAPFEVRPTDHGFASEFASEVKGVGNGANFWPYKFRDQPIRWVDIPNKVLGENEYLVDRMNHQAVKFIEQNHQQPFFLLLSHYATHSILNGKKELVEKYRRKHPPGKSHREKCYLCQDAGHQGDPLNHWASDHNPHLAAMLESIDDGVGLIMKKLVEKGIQDNTIVIFTSDNGGETQVTSNAPLRGGKSQLYEGGIRIPLVVHWPGRVPVATVSQQPTVNVDFYPTLLAAAQVKPPEAQVLDGISCLPNWSDPQVPLKREAIYWHYPLDKPHFLGGRSAAAVRAGDWKLIDFFDDGHAELYNLRSDVGEQHDVAQKHPQRVAQLRARLASWRHHVQARTPSPLMMARAGKSYFQDSFSAGQVSDRWFFRSPWSLKDEALWRNELPAENDRIFIKNPEYRDVVMRFDFRFEGARDIRLLTGTPGHYNAVVHIQPDHFYVQTARDQSVPYYPSIQGECVCEFEPHKWYTMTVEIVKDEIVAHVDREHFVVSQHPILDRQRSYFAFQVDRSSASLDNVQILQATASKQWQTRRGQLKKIQSARKPLARSPKDRYQRLLMNARGQLYRTDEQFRQLVAKVDGQKSREHEKFPEVFSSIKQVRKGIDQQRRELQSQDRRYQDLQKQINQARQAERDYVLGQDKRLKTLPKNELAAAFERARQKHQKEAQYQALVKERETREQQMRQAFPELSVTNGEIQAAQRAARKKLANQPGFKKLIQETAQAVHAERDYLINRYPTLQQLHKELFDN
jgi:arylsulfatase A